VISRPESPLYKLPGTVAAGPGYPVAFFCKENQMTFTCPLLAAISLFAFGAAAAGADVGKTTAVPVSELLGREVEDKAGETAGEVKDLVVNLSDGHIRYFVVETEDGTQARLHPDMLFAGSGGNLVVDANLEKLRAHRSAALEK
jgi:sporulation protein YlmC with PRC-barrel domain